MTDRSPMYGAFGTHIRDLITPARRLGTAAVEEPRQAPAAPGPGNRAASSTERSPSGHPHER